MAVAKWSWETVNPSSNETGSTYALSGATADEVKKAYNALTTKGAVSNFSYKVWNDMCLKLKDLITEWGTGATLEDVWVNSPNQSDYPDEATFKKSDGGIMKAAAMNKAASAFPNFVEKPFKGQLKKGDPCKAEYFLLFVESINLWCKLTAEQFSILMKIICNEKCRGILGKAMILPLTAENMKLLMEMKIDVFNTLAFQFILQLLFFSEATISTEQPTVIGARKNNFKFQSSCLVLDKIFGILNPEQVNFLIKEKATVVISNLMQTSAKSGFYYVPKMNIIVAITQYVRILADMKYSSNAEVYAGNPFYFKLRHRYEHESEMTISTEQPTIIGARGAYRYEGRATFEFQDGTRLEAESGVIAFADNFDNGDVIGKAFSHDGEFEVKTPYIDIQKRTGKSLESKEKVVITDEFDCIAGSRKEFAIDGKINVFGNQELKTQEPFPIEHESRLSVLDGEIKLDFGNDKELETKEEIKIKDGEIELSEQLPEILEHNGIFETKEKISLGESETKIMSGEEIISQDYRAELSFKRSINQSADVIISMLSQAEINSFLHKDIEAEVTTKIITLAQLSSETITGIDAETSVSTIQSAIIATVIQKILEGREEISTKQSGEIMTRKMRYIESLINEITVFSDGVVDSAKVAAIAGQETKTMISENAILDMIYTRGKIFASDVFTQIISNAEISGANNRNVESDSRFQTESDAEVSKFPTKTLNGNQVASSESEATVALAQIQLILAETYEDRLASELDDILADEMERTLVIV